MIPLLAIVISFSFALGFATCDARRERERKQRRRALKARFQRDAGFAVRQDFASRHPLPTLAELHSRGITTDDIRQALEALRK